VSIPRNSHMTNERIEIITSVERRRRWSSAEKERLVVASLAPGASVSAIAREAGLHASQLYGWRRQLRTRRVIGFAPVEISPEAAATDVVGVVGPGTIEIEFASGARMRIMGAVDAATLRAAVTALSDGRRR
jgi:transposase